MLSDNWTGLYREGWGSRLRPASYAHPAKNSYGLSVRIYEHALAEGWIEPGQYVVDCFSGVGGFALEAMRNGLHFVGCELEQRFVDMGQGCDCTGISKEDWVRYQGRWDRMRYAGERHWCPQCLAEAKEIEHDRGQLRMFARAPSASYVRNSGKVPCTGAHHYCGNIETWEQDGMAGTAMIVQGDSRRLGEVLARAQICVSSPPYAGSDMGSRGGEGPNCLWRDGAMKADSEIANRSLGTGYGSDPANLGNLPDTGFEAALAVASPVYIGSTASDDPDKRGGLYRDPKRRNDKTLTATYSKDAAQLAQMPDGDLALALGSPPYIGTAVEKSSKGVDLQKQYDTYRSQGGGASFQAFCETQRKHSQGYGDAPGQLAALPEGDHAEALEAGAVTPACAATADRGRAQAVISSPPWENIVNTKDPKYVEEKRLFGDYGNTAGQLGQETGSTFWAASREILEQVYQVLAPGGHAIWVVKMFVRNKQLVDFPGQWEALCQSVGFRTVCKHRAWLNKNAGVVQVAFDGEEVSMEKWFKSFFRRLAESKGSPRIDWELVLCMVKE